MKTVSQPSLKIWLFWVGKHHTFIGMCSVWLGFLPWILGASWGITGPNCWDSWELWLLPAKENSKSFAVPSFKLCNLEAVKSPVKVTTDMSEPVLSWACRGLGPKTGNPVGSGRPVHRQSPFVTLVTGSQQRRIVVFALKHRGGWMSSELPQRHQWIGCRPSYHWV